MQTWQGPITRDWLCTQSHGGYSGWEISEILEGFLIEYLSDSLYRRRVQLCGGTKGYGLEMRRWLFHEFAGGSEAVMLGGSRRLQDWSRCTKMEQLSQHLDDWVECLQQYGTELLAAPGILRTMVLGIIPVELEDELLSKPNVKTWQEIINWCKVKTVYRRQKILSEAAKRPGSGRVNSLHAEAREQAEEYREVAPQAQAAQAAAPADDSQPPEWFREYVNAVKGKGGGKGASNRRDKGKAEGKSRGVRIQFSGCWHCGKAGHARGGCTEFQEIMAKFNKGVAKREDWKLPPNYAGKYEVAKKKAKALEKKRVNMLDGGSDVDTEGEWEDSDQDIMGSDLGQACRALRFNQTPTSNSFNELCGRCKDSEDGRSDSEDDDLPDLVGRCCKLGGCAGCDAVDCDEIEVQSDEVETMTIDMETAKTLSMWAHKLSVQLKDQPTDQIKSYVVDSIGKLDKLLKNKSKISRIAASPGKKRMKRLSELVPGIPLEEDEVVCLVDSGSTINAAWIEEHFPEYLQYIILSEAQTRGDSATTAGGHELKNEGRCRVETKVDGHDFPVAFQNMRVDVPILSVRKYVKSGFAFHFSEEGGYMESKTNGKRFWFIESDGAFWIKMKVTPPSADDPITGFARPGHH